MAKSAPGLTRSSILSKTIVFIDSRVEDHPTLIRGLSADCEPVWLDATQDGLQQMQAALADRRDLASIRILAHGRPGVLTIGSGELTRERVASHAEELAAIGRALGDDGDVQIYGCEVGKGSDGRAFVRALAEALGAPVAASSALVGHADLGGAWRLNVGELRTPPIHNASWHGLLGMTITPVTHSYDHSAGEWRNWKAFAALRADGSVVTWGNGGYGGDSSAVAAALDGTIDVTQVFSTPSAFAALRVDGSLVTWGGYYGGDSSAVAAVLDGTIDVTQVFSTLHAFAALRADGSVVTWGYSSSGNWGEDSSVVAAALDGTIDVTQVASTERAFAALRADGSVVTWGEADYGGDSSAVAAGLNGTIDVTQIFSTSSYDGAAFAALRADGSVVTWGNSYNGGDSSAVAAALNGTIDVTQVFSTGAAFAALRADGSVVTWGKGNPLYGANYGGDSSAVAAALNGTIDVTQVFSTGSAFAALRADGSLVTWGYGPYGGDSSAVAAALNGTIDVTQVFSTSDAFAALRADGSVVTWGDGYYGGNSSAVAAKLDGTIDVTQVFSNDGAFAALRADGSVVTWGGAYYGGNSSAVATKLDGTIDVTQVFSTASAFAALRADGSVVTWGDDPYNNYGSNSSAVASQLHDVVGMANPFTNDVYTSTTSDTTAPTVLSFNPTDGATGVAPGSHIVLTFSESIARGTGSIVLKTAAGATIENFNAATSNRLTLSGSTLTIDPTSTLANGTNYYLTFAAGTIKDLAGNAYAGITTYDFTTASATSPLS
ncbi:DUF4347 domain-containing protein, partial [Candidatus Accumulibacter phosphatis]|uniref:DUF4347 domain-containing protein n=1 Tax=Candidatus Accumulibacter phosphatis TaxID=327160 RepID=UPI00110A6554